MNSEKYVNLKELSKKFGCEIELFSSETTRNTFSAERRALKNKKTAFIKGYAVRAIKQRRLGFAFFEREQDFEKALKRALKLSKACEPSTYFFSSERAQSTRFASRKLEEAAVLEKLEEMASAVEGAAEPATQVFSTSTAKTSVATPEGEVTQRFTQFYAYSECAKNKGEGADSESSSAMDFSPKEVAVNSANYANAMASPKKPSPGEQEIVFDVQALQDFLHLFLPFNFSGESLRKRVTRLKPGMNIGCEDLSLYDEPLLKSGLNSAEYDDEGFRTKRKALIECGIVKNFVFDMPTATKFGGGNPGNGWRSSFQTQPSPGFSNLVIQPGETKDFVSECKRGVYVVSFLTMGANAVTGDFSLPLQTAFSIKKGEFSSGIAGATLAGNFFDVLKNVEFERKQRKRHDVLAPRAKFRAKIIA